ncbi:hypothetical protein ABAC460_11125 [Asticcacaulis sp. AC460]|uniref:hypothetical protein n=1 Tax=Asticcacaulis sp. AC460 TaxID=1282360 RepID=UPI0003C3BB52|nr:hypothetical protein [Asticcacaulis sp. AC460]ESQ89847.1 hypothetical protein ABAC460_11125 [Asticcacaulis sp. AC460]
MAIDGKCFWLSPADEDPDWQPDDKESLILYVENGPMILAAATLEPPCTLCGARLGSVSWQYDGVWLWPGDTGHYVRLHGFRLPDAFVDDVRARNYQCVAVDEIDYEKLPWPSDPA